MDRWEAGFDRLCRFVEREGDANVPAAFVDDDGYSLGRWVYKAWARYASGKLPPAEKASRSITGLGLGCATLNTARSACPSGLGLGAACLGAPSLGALAHSRAGVEKTQCDH